MNPCSSSRSSLPGILQWSGAGRLIVFTLAAMSIWCLLAEMYGLCDMRSFFLYILIPSTAVLYGTAFLDRSRGDRRLWRAVMIGSAAGLIGAAAYDIFRLPFVFSDAWGLGRVGIPQMPLFKVFPRFGALILGQVLEQGVPAGQPGAAWGAGYPLSAHLLGWLYHFSNGATFGVMFTAMYCSTREAFGVPRERQGADGAYAQTTGWLRPILCAAAMAVGIEICMLLSPYATFFSIHLTTRFVIVTMAAHLIFGVALGAWYQRQALRWRLPVPVWATPA